MKISWKRAITLVDRMHAQRCGSAGGRILVHMDHEQLARYTAIRDTEGVKSIWVYPGIGNYAPGIPDPAPQDVLQEPIEIRPGARSIPGKMSCH